MKVLFLSTSQGGRGGGEHYLRLLIEELVQAPGVVAEVAMSQDPCMDWLAESLSKSGIGTHRLRIRNLLAYKTRAIGCCLDPRNSRRIARLIRRTQPDIVHVNQQNSEDGLDLVRTAARILPGRVVGTIHNAQLLRSIVTHGRVVREWWAGWFHRRYNYDRIFVSWAQLRSFEQAVPGFAGRNHVVLNGVPRPSDATGVLSRRAARKQLGLLHDQPVIGFAGRFTRQKNVEAAVSAFAATCERHPGTMLVLAGDGEDSHAIRRQIAHLGIERRVLLPGYLRGYDLEAFYRAIDVLLLPSRWEAFGFVLAEAMLRGVPVIATAVDGIVEALDCGRAGFLVPPGNVNALSAAISSMLASPDLRAHYSRRGIQFATMQLTARRMAQETAGVYAQVCTHESAGHPQ